MEKKEAYTIFKKCPVCKNGKVRKMEKGGLFGIINRVSDVCDKCYAIFKEQESPTVVNEKRYSLDLSDSEKKSKYEGQILFKHEWERISDNGLSDIELAKIKKDLPDITIKNKEEFSFIFKNKEKLHWVDFAVFQEERAIRVYHHGFGGFRLTKGVYVGGGKGYGESHGELRKIDSGFLILTSNRLVFNGRQKHYDVRLNKINIVQVVEGGIGIGVEGRQKVMIFSLDNPEKWEVYLKLAIQKSA